MPARAFSLLMDTRQAVAALIGECRRRGAMTTQLLELAWRARVIVCGECLAAIPVGESALQAMQRQAIDVATAIDRLTRVSQPPANN
jgi:hypothetical protein